MSSRLLRNVSEAAPAGAAPAAGDAAKRRALRDPVLFVVSTLGIGGSERKIVRLANALSARGRRVALAYLNEPDALAAELDSAVPADNLRRKGKFSIAALHRLHTLIELHGARAVISVNLYPTLYTGLLARLSRRSQHVRFIASLNTTDLGERTQKQMLLYRPALRAMDELIFGAEHQRRLWSARQLQGRSPPSRVLYNGVDTEYFDRTTVPAWRPPDWPRNRRVIGAVGMLRAEKSHDHL
ncbi:MAG TPA: glycosyltransferase, partial [Steroidobacter sp.]|nr:glycosyltransferase [Steroidobacter sp.]